MSSEAKPTMKYNLVSLNTDIPNDDQCLGYDSRTKSRELEGMKFCAQGLPPAPYMVRPLGAGQFEWVEVDAFTWIDLKYKKAVAMILPEYITAEVAEAALLAALSKGAKLLKKLDSIESSILSTKPAMERLSDCRKEAIISRLRSLL